MRLAGLQPYGVLCELTNPDGSMARLPEVVQFALRHQMPVLSIADLVAYRQQHEKLARKAVGGLVLVENSKGCRGSPCYHAHSAQSVLAQSLNTLL